FRDRRQRLPTRLPGAPAWNLSRTAKIGHGEVVPVIERGDVVKRHCDVCGTAELGRRVQPGESDAY
ncbi:hypothetical protein, partial [Spongiactinospora sp. 9N601]|uniref:hypothetical protein n=1 Tax=Spongiactinospora sp. 9N601 TaxID=3375149 RepID=UPI00379B72CA